MAVIVWASTQLEAQIVNYAYGKADGKTNVVVPNGEVATALGVTEEAIRTIRVSLMSAGLASPIFGGIALTPEAMKKAQRDGEVRALAAKK